MRFMVLAALAWAPTAQAQPLPIDSSDAAGEPVLSFDSPLGPIEYRAGRGLRVGRTGLTIGGFTTVEFDDPEHEDATIELDGVNFLLLYQPVDALRLFAELELGGLFVYEPDRDEIESDPELVIERLYGDWTRSDALNLRVGKFQTPIGRWNLVPAEPFVWTAVDPVLLERAFDEHQTGVALFGTVYPGANTLSYWLYGQVVDPLDAGEDPPPADRSAGGRVEYGDALGTWSLGSSLLATERKGEWSYLAGLDGLLRLGPLELSSELVFGEGGIPDRDLWAAYLQGVYDLESLAPMLQGLHLVARFEHFGPDGASEDANLWDFGFAWLPKPWLTFKAGWRLSDRVTDDVVEGLTASISVLF